MAEALENGEVSPIEASPTDVSPVERLQRDQQQTRQVQNHPHAHSPHHRWSTTTAATDMDVEKGNFEAPPVPPIPCDTPQSWRTRSMKRDSYTSQMSGRTSYCTIQGFGGEVDSTKRNHSSTASISPSLRTTVSRPRSRSVPRRVEKTPFEDLHWYIAASNPRNWSKPKKWFHTFATAIVGFVCLFASSIMAPAHSDDDFREDFGVSRFIATFPTAFFVLGLALGPSISAPASEIIGRRLVYVLAMPMFAAFTLGSAFIEKYYALVVCRLLAGVFASPALNLGYSTLSDIWSPEDLAPAISTYTAVTLLGLTLGPLVGAYVIQPLDWYWLQYVILFAFAASIGPMVCMKETSKSVILRRKNAEPRNNGLLGPSVLGPFQVLFTSPTLLLSSLYSASVFGALYAAFAVFPDISRQVYGFNVGTSSLTFAGMAVGIVVGLVILLINHSFIYKTRVELWRDARSIEAEREMSSRRRTDRWSLGSIAASRLSKNKSTVSVTMRPILSKNSSRTSLVSKRMSMGHPGNNPTPLFQDRNTHLAVAAAKFLHSVRANEGRRILPERILLILQKNPTFTDLCVQLEAYGLRFDRVKLAIALDTALRNPPEPPELTDGADASRSTSEHRQATAAALDSPRPASSIGRPLSQSRTPSQLHLQSSPRPLTASQSQLDLLLPVTPPAEWRLWPCLFGTAFAAGSLFMFGWGANPSVHWVVPTLAMGILACGALLVLVSVTQYITDCYGPERSEQAVAASSIVRFVLSCAFALFAVPLFDRLGTAWASSVLAFIAVGLGCTPWVLVLLGPALRKRRTPGSGI